MVSLGIKALWGFVSMAQWMYAKNFNMDIHFFFFTVKHHKILSTTGNNTQVYLEQCMEKMVKYVEQTCYYCSLSVQRWRSNVFNFQNLFPLGLLTWLILGLNLNFPLAPMLHNTKNHATHKHALWIQIPIHSNKKLDWHDPDIKVNL